MAAQSAGDPLGGSRRLLANANLYFSVPGLENGDNTKLSLFMDVGQVYGDAEPMSFSDLRASVGVAFNWFTAIGPLALSYGLPLNAEASDRTRKFQITLGTLFR
jgi:outer membrane protein insertion porin family